MSTPRYTTACPDWAERIRAKQSLVPCGALYPDQAQKALSIFKQLILTDVAGSPPIGAISRQWIDDFVGAIFGAYNQETGDRLIQEFFLLISKKNAKSTISAGIMLTALILNWRKDAEFFIIAPTVEVANNSFKPIKSMIRADHELNALFKVQDHVRTITHLGNGATLKVIAADSETLAGIKGSGVLIEEVWLFGKRAKASDMFTEAKGGLASRPEGFVIYLSTHSDEQPAGVFSDLLKRGRDVRDGKVINNRFLPVLYEFPPEMLASGEHLQPENFYITNPNLGASVSEAFLLGEYHTAKQDGELAVRRFMAKHLNVPIGIALANDYWAGAEFWQRQGSLKACDLDYIMKYSDVITVGVDGGGLDDLFGLSVMGRDAQCGDQFFCWTHAWAHPIVLQRRKEIAAQLQDFAKQGDLTLVQAVGDDIHDIAMLLMRIERTGKLAGVGFDRYGISDLLERLRELGLSDELMYDVPQGYRLNGYVKTLERWLAGGKVHHNGSPMMSWVVGNARVEIRGNNVHITKNASGSAKIDPLMALFDAVSVMASNPEPQYVQPQIYVL